MNIGALDRKIYIEAATTTQDLAGEEVESWGLYAVLYARRVRKSANEGVTSEQLVATKVETYQARWKGGVSEKMRLIDGGVLYNIRAVSELGRKAGLEIIAESTGKTAVPNAPTGGIVDELTDTFDFTLATY